MTDENETKTETKPEESVSENKLITAVSAKSFKSSNSSEYEEESKASERRASNSSHSSRRTSGKSVQFSTNYFNEYFADFQPACIILKDAPGSEVIKAVGELRKKVTRLKVENGVFYRYIMKAEAPNIEPSQTGRKVSIMSQRRSSILSTTSGHDRKSMLLIPQHFSALAQPETEQKKICMNQKSDLVSKDLEESQAKHQKTHKKSEATRRKLLSQLEERETRKTELETSLQNFEQLKSTYETFTLDKFERFMEEWSKKSRLMADKTRLRYSSLKVQYQKLSALLAHKKLIGENLQEIDFEQLRIENAHLIEKIDKKNILLMELKKMTGAGNLKLSQHKEVLQEKMIKKAEIIDTINLIEKEIAKSDDLIDKTYQELEDVKQQHNRVRERIRKYQAPDVLDYLEKKAELDYLRKQMSLWSRKKSLKDMSLNIDVSRMKKILRCNKIHSCWFE